MISPPTRSPSRLVARSRRPGQRRSRPSATCGGRADDVLAVVEHQHQVVVADHLGEPVRVRQAEGSGDRRRDTGGITDGRQLDEAPAEARASPAAARPTSTASRVLPTPPGPTSVTKRCSANSSRRSRSSASRPTSGVSASGMLGCDPAPTATTSPEQCAGECQRRVLGEDRRLQPAQLGPRFEAELLDQQAATLLEHPQRISLAPGAVQRQHQQPTQALAQRMVRRRAARAGRRHVGAGPTGARDRAVPRAARAATPTTG